MLWEVSKQISFILVSKTFGTVPMKEKEDCDDIMGRLQTTERSSFRSPSVKTDFVY